MKLLQASSLAVVQALSIVVAQSALASPSGQFEPAKCSFNGSMLGSCSVMQSYINRAGGWTIKIRKSGGKVFVFRQENKAAGDPFRDSSGKIWSESYDSRSRRQSFFNQSTKESIIIQY